MNESPGESTADLRGGKDCRLRVEQIAVRRGGTFIVRELDLEVAAGEVVALLGPSGAGKSTVFRALAGEEPIQAGRILLDGIDVGREPLWRRVRRGLGWVPQGPSVLFDLTVRDNAITFARLVGRPEHEVLSLLTDFDLGSRTSIRAADLSGGERRRLELVRALSGRPTVLVCDEPFAGVDPRGAEMLAERLRDIAVRREVAVLLADHHVGPALSIADRVVLLLEGRMHFCGSPAEFAAHPLAQDRYLARSVSGDVLAAVSERR